MPNIPPAPTSKPNRRRRRNILIAAAVAVALIVGGGLYWLTRPSYDDIVKGCQKALVAQVKAGGKASRPPATT